jgi:DNA replication protein DnaC
MGSCGVGKTHLAVSALKQIVLRGHSGLFYDYRELASPRKWACSNPC